MKSQPTAPINVFSYFRDRLSTVWDEAGSHMQRVTLWAATRSAACLTRALTALLRTAARLLRCHQCAPQALQHGAVLFALPYKLFYQQAVVVSSGIISSYMV